MKPLWKTQFVIGRRDEQRDGKSLNREDRTKMQEQLTRKYWIESTGEWRNGPKWPVTQGKWKNHGFRVIEKCENKISSKYDSSKQSPLCAA